MSPIETVGIVALVTGHFALLGWTLAAVVGLKVKVSAVCQRLNDLQCQQGKECDKR